LLGWLFAVLFFCFFFARLALDWICFCWVGFGLGWLWAGLALDWVGFAGPVWLFAFAEFAFCWVGFGLSWHWAGSALGVVGYLLGWLWFWAGLNWLFAELAFALAWVTGLSWVSFRLGWLFLGWLFVELAFCLVGFGSTLGWVGFAFR